MKTNEFDVHIKFYVKLGIFWPVKDTLVIDETFK